MAFWPHKHMEDIVGRRNHVGTLLGWHSGCGPPLAGSSKQEWGVKSCQPDARRLPNETLFFIFKDFLLFLETTTKPFGHTSETLVEDVLQHSLKDANNHAQHASHRN